MRDGFLYLYRFTAIFLIVISTAFDSYSREAAIDLTELTIDELMNIEVTTVSKKAERFMDVAAAVYVITSEDIRRSGVRTIPDALRMVPGVEVAQIDANKSAISIRGFNERFSIKLLVLIDGRSVYTPLFAGVLWEEIDVLLQDIERIEVWRGPGGTLWGANAVNGVINIITKSSEDTQGFLVETGAGNEERGFVDFRYGGVTGEDFNYRIYGKFFNRDNSGGRDGRGAHDSWSSIRGGFRTDWDFSEKDSLTVQGDIYRIDFDETLEFSLLKPPFLEQIKVDGHYVGLNLLSRWLHEYSANSNAAVQVYYDFTRRFIHLGKERRHTFDIDAQHRFPIEEHHDIVWGLGYRLITDRTSTLEELFDIRDNDRTDVLYSGFIQDEISFFDRSLRLIIGSKFEHNSYSGFEIQPNARLFVDLHPKHKFWAAVSRAVRTPSRLDDGIRFRLDSFPDPESGLPVEVILTGNSDFDPEELIAYEVGYRLQPVDWVFIDITAFFNYYDNLLTFELGEPSVILGETPKVVQPIFFDNNADGKTYGFEVASTVKPFDFWKLQANYTLLKMDIDGDDSNDPTAEITEDRVAENRFSIQSNLDLPYDLQFDSTLYYVGDLDIAGVSDYFRLDLRLGWEPIEGLELSLVGQNLLDGGHSEFGKSFFFLPTEIERSLYGSIRWTY